MELYSTVNSGVEDNVAECMFNMFSARRRKFSVGRECELREYAVMLISRPRYISSMRRLKHHVDASFRIDLKKRIPALVVSKSEGCEDGCPIQSSSFHCSQNKNTI